MKNLFRKEPAPRADRRKVAGLYGRVMAQARQPFFFTQLGLPDSFETRFELLFLHMFLVLGRLKTMEAARGLMQGLIEYMIDDLDRAFREAGIGDMGVAKRMKKLLPEFYGRLLAYETALAASDEKEILRALDRNLFAACDTNLQNLAIMREYLLRQRAALAAQPLEAFIEGKEVFAPGGLS
ncbi:MAG TPA: ubiquinol-cytochrome C chaperone family protein [Alphaproteobacteria bacterium]|nr:ubiquinol-cytochrome C chaperone family protein [Alphaproteobacteria bacterium]